MMRRNVLEGFVFKAPNDSERRVALAMRSRIYAAELGSAGLDRFDEAAHHLVALTPDAQVIATVRIIGPYLAHIRCMGTFTLDGILRAIPAVQHEFRRPLVGQPKVKPHPKATPPRACMPEGPGECDTPVPAWRCS